MNTEIGSRDLARLLGVTQKTIALWAKAGVVTRTAHGKFDHDASIMGYAEHMRSLVAAKGGETAAASVATERAGLLAVQRKRAEREFERECGKLVNADEFGEAMTTVCRGLRVHLMLVPQRVGGRAPHFTREDIRLIDDEVRAALTEVSQMSLAQVRAIAVEAVKEIAPA